MIGVLFSSGPAQAIKMDELMDDVMDGVRQETRQSIQQQGKQMTREVLPTSDLN